MRLEGQLDLLCGRIRLDSSLRNLGKRASLGSTGKHGDRAGECGQCGRRGDGRPLQGVLDNLELHQQFGRLALDGGQPKMAIEHVLGAFEDGVERIGIGGGHRQLNLAAEFEPGEMHQRQPDTASNSPAHRGQSHR